MRQGARQITTESSRRYVPTAGFERATYVRFYGSIFFLTHDVYYTMRIKKNALPVGQYVVLSNIVSMSLRRKDLFEPYLKSFYVRSNSDPLHIRLLKLEILTNLATETNISAILREFQTYISQTDKEFVAATIQAIGRCASNIKGAS